MNIHAFVMSAGEAIASFDPRLSALHDALASERAARMADAEKIAALTQERDRLRASYEQLRLELEMLKRRLFVAKAERVDTSQLQLEFAETLRALHALAGTTPQDTDKTHRTEPGAPDATHASDPPKAKAKPTGRRDLKKLPLPEERIELSDPVFEPLVEQGLVKRIGFEESCKLAYQRGGLRRVVTARVKYQTIDAQGDTAVETTPMPAETFPRSLAAPSLLAHVIMAKYGMGLPLFRLEDQFTRDGCPLDRGTMCRWVEDAGATLGATVVHAMRCDALSSSFCIATDATGVLVQPIRTHEKARQACRRGHYFVLVADAGHVLFEFTPKETSDAVRSMFQGFTGYLQADAKSVYDILYRGPPDEHEPDCCKEVACYAHLRRKFWEAALAQSAIAREGLVRIGCIFDLDASWRHKPPADIKRLRDAHLRPHANAFFQWAAVQYDSVRDQRGLLRSALGYAVRQKDALLRVFDDGRLILDNNRSERALRGTIATGRKAWLFVGSDDHGQSAAHLFSVVASCRMHRLDPEAYLRDLFRLLAHWPRDRYLELTPKYWAATRARLDLSELGMEVGPLTIPAPFPATEQQSSPNGSG